MNVIHDALTGFGIGTLAALAALPLVVRSLRRREARHAAKR